MNCPLVLDVERLATLGFDWDRIIAKGANVVWACLHVDDAGALCEEKRGAKEGAADPRIEFVAAFIKVHRGVEAPWLLVCGACESGKGYAVARGRLGRKKPKRIEMCAGQGMALNDLFDR
jgi:hypothetical protein